MNWQRKWAVHITLKVLRNLELTFANYVPDSPTISLCKIPSVAT